MKKINVAELLKDCPSGMELDCSVYDNVTLEKVCDDIYYPIVIKINGVNFTKLTKYGQILDIENSKCVIFPKGKTTWEGFAPPCSIKAGDVLVSMTGNIVLFSHVDSRNAVHYHCIIPTNGSFRIEENTNIGVGNYYDCVLADEQQRQRMYAKIKSAGYKYNQQLNRLEKVSNKFDITTLTPFDKVLVRLDSDNNWYASLFSHIDNLKSFCYKFITIAGKSYTQIIPYNEETKHLLGTNNDCPEYYKING